jgi:hypothetical protein
MGANHVSAIDDPILGDTPAAEQKAFTESEVAAIEHTVRFSEVGTTVYTDQSYGAILRYYIDEPIGYHLLFFNIEEAQLISRANGPKITISRRYMMSGHTRFDIRLQDTRVGVRGEVPIGMAVSGQSKVYQAESRCNEYPCGIYLQN